MIINNVADETTPTFPHEFMSVHDIFQGMVYLSMNKEDMEHNHKWVETQLAKINLFIDWSSGHMNGVPGPGNTGYKLMHGDIHVTFEETSEGLHVNDRKAVFHFADGVSEQYKNIMIQEIKKYANTVTGIQFRFPTNRNIMIDAHTDSMQMCLSYYVTRPLDRITLSLTNLSENFNICPDINQMINELMFQAYSRGAEQAREGKELLPCFPYIPDGYRSTMYFKGMQNGYNSQLRKLTSILPREHVV